MGTNSDRLRGLVVHDYRVTADTIDSTETTADQAGPYPGPAVDQGASQMYLRTSGSMAAADQYTIDCVRGGYPASAGVGAGFTYTRDSVEYFWDPPGAVSGREFVAFRTAGSGTETSHKEYEPSLCRLADGTVLMATRGLVVGTGEVSIRIRSYDPDTDTWTLLENITDSDYLDDTERIGPCLVVMPSGDVHLYHWISADEQIALWVSTDDGANWTRSSVACLTSLFSVPTDYGVSLRGAYSQGQVVLMMGLEGYGADISEFAICTSSDGGYTFTPDKAYADADTDWNGALGMGCLPLFGGGFHLAWAEGFTGGNLAMYHWSSGSGFVDLRAIGTSETDTFNESTTVTYAAEDTTVEGGNHVGEWSGCTWVGEDWTYYLVYAAGFSGYSPPPDRGALVVRGSGDPGADPWDLLLQTQVTDFGSAAGDDTCIRRPSAVETRGMTVMASEVQTATGDIDDGTIAIWYLGGHTSVSLPPAAAVNSPNRAQFAWQFHGLVDPDSGSAWTSVTSTGTLTQQSDGLDLSCTSTQAYLFKPNVGEEPTDESAELILECEISDVTGGAKTRTGARLRYRHSASLVMYEAKIRIDASTLEIYDVYGTTVLGSAAMDFTDGPVTIRLAVYRDRCNAWYYQGNASRAERKWTSLVSAGTLTSAVDTSSFHFVRWGVLSTGTGTVSIRFNRFCLMEVPSGGTLSSVGIADLDGYPRLLSSSPITLPGGLTIEALDGPAAPDDQWVISTAYQYGFENLLSANPGQPWRSTQDNTAMTIAWDLSDGDGGGGVLEVAALGAALLSSNLRRWKIQYQTASGKGTNLDLIDVYAAPFADPSTPSGEEIHAFIQGAGVLLPDSGAGEPVRWLEHNELAGAQCYDPTADASYRIIGNSSGRWDGEYTQREAQIFLNTDDNPDSLAGPDIYIHMRNSAGFTWDYMGAFPPRWLVLTIPAQKTWEGYYEIGRFIAGPLKVFGKEYSEDRALERRANVLLTTRRDGSRTAYSRGSQRRSVTVAWREGIDETALYSTSVPTIDGFTTNGFVAAPADTMRTIRGVFSEVDGSSEPVLYLPAIPTDIESGSLNRADALLYGRIVSQMEIGQIIGNEEENTVYRVSAVRIEEEVG